MNEKEYNAWTRKHIAYTKAILYVVFDRQNEDMLLVYGTFKCRSTMGWKAAMGM